MTTPPVPMPARGEVWTANLDPVKGHEQKGTRPVLIVSIDTLNRARVQRTVVVPISTIRLTSRHGDISDATLAEVEEQLVLLLGL